MTLRAPGDPACSRSRGSSSRSGAWSGLGPRRARVRRVRGRVDRGLRRLRRALHGRAERGPGAAALRRLPRHRQGAGAALREPLLHQEADLAARAQLRERAAQGQRHGRQPDRDRGDRGLARRRHRRGRLRGGRLRELREGPDRVRRAQPGDALPLRRAPRGRAVAAREHRRGGEEPAERDPGPPGQGRASR